MKTMNCSGALLCLFLLLSPSDKQGLLLARVSDYTMAPLSAAPNEKTSSIVNVITNDIPASVNLYYTDATFSAGTGISLSGAGVISAFNTTTSWNPYNPSSTSN